MAGGLILLLLIGFGAAAVAAVVVWSRRGLPTRVVWRLTLLGFVALLASSANDWPASAAAFSTAQPWGVQAGAMATALVLLSVIAAPAIGLVGAVAHAWLADADGVRVPGGAALAWGLALGGVTLLAPVLVPRPESGDYSAAASFIPILSAATSLLPPYLLLTSAILAIVAVRVHFHRRTFVATTLGSLAVAAALVVVPVELQTSVTTWGLGALAVGSVMALGLHLCSATPALVPGIVATTLGVRSLWSTWTGPYSDARWGGLIAAVVLGLAAWEWTRELTGGGAPRVAVDQSPEETRASVGSE